MKFRATLTNAKPPGEIQSTGAFGPWQNDEPSLTPVSGNYTFQNADLSVFKGIAGKLASEGTYKGVLGRIEVDGWTDTTGIKSFFLKLADPLFKKKGAGAVIPIKISDTQAEPKFGLDPGRVFSGK